MALIDKVKSQCNYKTSARDADFQDLIMAGIADLRKQGVDASEETDNPRIIQAVVLYCKAYGQPEYPNADRFLSMYEGLKAALSMQEGDPNVV